MYGDPGPFLSIFVSQLPWGEPVSLGAHFLHHYVLGCHSPKQQDQLTTDWNLWYCVPTQTFLPFKLVISGILSQQWKTNTIVKTLMSGRKKKSIVWIRKEQQKLSWATVLRPFTATISWGFKIRLSCTHDPLMDQDLQFENHGMLCHKALLGCQLAPIYLWASVHFSVMYVRISSPSHCIERS